MTEPFTDRSGRRVSQAPEQTWEQETRRVASRRGTTAVALAASKESHAALHSSHAAQSKIAENLRWVQRERGLFRASPTAKRWPRVGSL
eukprot:2408442-Prymnesium_polylepis.1